jgi:ATP-dependent helicase/nuclease subunit A
LRRFPLEAGIAPHFEVLDDRSAAELLQSARESVLSRARSGADQDLAAALAEVTAQCSEDAFAELMQSLLAERGRLAHLLAGHGGCDGLVVAIRELLGLEPDECRDSLLKAACEDGAIDLLGLRLAVEALLQGSKTDRERGDGIAAWLAAPDRRAAEFETYRRRFLTEGSAAGLKIRERLITKAAEAASPGVKAVLQAEAERLHALSDRLNAAMLAAASGALLTLGGAILDAYRRQKEVRAQLDYDDLILASRDLLKRPGIAPWVLFKLDGGLDHILIDEAQDTNPDQWQVVQALAEEFFVGAGARPETRTIFAVGDPKQSIFSFQRADPAAFEAMRKHFSDRAAAARTQWEDVPLNISFRSTAAVLSAVDAVFASAEAQAGVALDGQPIVHQPSRVGHAGLVELWPPAQPREMAELEPWAPPIDRQPGDSPRGRLARLIAAQIETMIASGEKLRSRDRPVRPGDFMVLVCRRNAFVEELVRELKQRQVPVAGVDRMVLTDQIAVMDLVAFGQFLLLPEDDLTLATVLKGPLVGLDEEELFRLAYGREGSLWAALRRRAEKEDVFARALAFLAERLAAADFVPPYELYADLLGRLGGRRALLGRLGPEAADPIDEFMNLALIYERAHVPSLQGFLHWLAVGDVEVKRDLEQDLRGQVRIMTIHGAKGLQAPIVFLPDTMQMPNHTARLLWCESKSNGDPGLSQALPLWSPRIGCDEAVARAARARHRQAEACEYRRLLYVALTRAEDRLYVCGWHGKQTPRSGCWYDLVGGGLAAIAEEADFDCTDLLGPDHGWSGRLLRLADPQLAVPESSGETPQTAAIDTPRPSWFEEPAPEEPLPWRPLAPSRPSDEEPPVQPPLGADDGLRFRRGRLIHRLLETLPEIPAAGRAAACRRFLARPTHDLSEAQQQEITAEVLRVLEDSTFAPLFGPDSRAEVMVVGEVRGEAGAVEVLSGRIDRLVVTGSAVLIVDYKTNRPPPDTPDGVPALYLRQMACYRAALSRIYPDRPITCVLLWTDGPRLMPLPVEQIDRYAP